MHTLGTMIINNSLNLLEPPRFKVYWDKIFLIWDRGDIQADLIGSPILLKQKMCEGHGHYKI